MGIETVNMTEVSTKTEEQTNSVLAQANNIVVNNPESCETASQVLMGIKSLELKTAID